MRRQVTLQRLSRRGASGRLELRRLRIGVFRMARFVGMDARAVVGFSGVSSSRWCRWGGNDRAYVVADAVGIARRVTKVRSNGTPNRTRDMRDWQR